MLATILNILPINAAFPPLRGLPACREHLKQFSPAPRSSLIRQGPFCPNPPGIRSLRTAPPGGGVFGIRARVPQPGGPKRCLPAIRFALTHAACVGFGRPERRRGGDGRAGGVGGKRVPAAISARPLPLCTPSGEGFPPPPPCQRRPIGHGCRSPAPRGLRARSGPAGRRPGPSLNRGPRRRAGAFTGRAVREAAGASGGGGRRHAPPRLRVGSGVLMLTVEVTPPAGRAGRNLLSEGSTEGFQRRTGRRRKPAAAPLTLAAWRAGGCWAGWGAASGRQRRGGRSGRRGLPETGRGRGCCGEGREERGWGWRSGGAGGSRLLPSPEMRGPFLVPSLPLGGPSGLHRPAGPLGAARWQRPEGLQVQRCQGPGSVAGHPGLGNRPSLRGRYGRTRVFATKAPLLRSERLDLPCFE